MARTPVFIQTLAASAARIANGNSGQIALRISPRAANFFLLVPAASGTSPTLDVFITTSFDGGVTNGNIVSFTRVTSGSTNHICPWSLLPNNNAQGSDILWGFGGSATSKISNGPINPAYMSCYWNIGGTTPSFTFSILAALVR